MEEEQKNKEKQKDRSVIGTAAGIFTWKWLVGTIASWGLSQWFTKLWNEYKAKKEKKKDGN